MHKMSFSVVLDVKKFLIEMWGGGSNNQEYFAKEGVCIIVRVRKRGEGDQILASLERTY